MTIRRLFPVVLSMACVFLVASIVSGGRDVTRNTSAGRSAPLDFGELEQVVDPTEFPYSATVRLESTFSFAGDEGQVCPEPCSLVEDLCSCETTCTGTLIDPFHVVTAAHCFHQDPRQCIDPDICEAPRFADTVVVTPAWQDPCLADDADPTDSCPETPFGSTAAAELFASTAWINTGARGADLGVIYLETPIGVLANDGGQRPGWLEVGFFPDTPEEMDCCLQSMEPDACSVTSDRLACLDERYFTRDFTHNGYPESTPGRAGLMWSWNGTFDSPGGELDPDLLWPLLQFARSSEPAQCGGGYATLDDETGAFVIHAVHQGNITDLEGSSAVAVRVDSTKFEEVGEWIGVHLKETPTLYLLGNDSSGPLAGEQGLPFSDLTVELLNYSTTELTGLTTVEILFSPQPDSLDGSVPLGSFDVDLGSGDGGVFQLLLPGSGLDVACDTPPGTYYLNVGVPGATTVASGDIVVEIAPDSTSPDLVCPENLVLECTEAEGTPVDNPAVQEFIAGASATDICDPDVEITNDLPEFVETGLTPVEFVATDDNGNSAACDRQIRVVDPFRFFSTARMRVVDGRVLWNHRIYASQKCAGGIEEATGNFIQASVGLDAVDFRPDGSILFSVARDGGVFGTGFLQANAIYSMDTGSMEISLLEDWGDLGASPGNVVALNGFDDGSFAFVIDSFNVVPQSTGPVFLYPANVYRFDRATGLIDLYLDGRALGLDNIDALTLLEDGRTVISTSTDAVTGSAYLLNENAYVHDGKGSFELFFDGGALVLRDLDAFDAQGIEEPLAVGAGVGIVPQRSSRDRGVRRSGRISLEP